MAASSWHNWYTSFPPWKTLQLLNKKLKNIVVDINLFNKNAFSIFKTNLIQSLESFRSDFLKVQGFENIYPIFPNVAINPIITTAILLSHKQWNQRRTRTPCLNITSNIRTPFSCTRPLLTKSF